MADRPIVNGRLGDQCPSCSTLVGNQHDDGCYQGDREEMESLRASLSQAKADLARAQMNEAHEHASSMDYALDAGARNAARVAHYEKLADTWKARAERAESNFQSAWAIVMDLAEVADERWVAARKSEALAKKQERVIEKLREALEAARTIVCSFMCESTWPSTRQRVHSAECVRVTQAALTPKFVKRLRERVESRPNWKRGFTKTERKSKRGGR